MDEIKYPADFELHTFPEFYDWRSRTNFVLDVTSSRILALHDNVLLALHFLRKVDENRAEEALRKRGLSAQEAAESLRLVRELVKKGHLRPRTDKTRAIPPKDHVIAFMNLNLAHECNLTCRYCYAASGTYEAIGGKGLMSWEVARAAIELLRTQNVRHYVVGLFGGEPLLNKPVIMKIIPYAKETLGNVSFMVSTNGTLLDDALIDLFSSNGIAVQISCDGGRTIQNDLRPAKPGFDSYDAVANAVALLRKRGTCTYWARATITNRCPSHREVMLQLLTTGFEHVHCQPISGESRLALTSEDVDRYCDDIRRLIRGGAASGSIYVQLVLSKVRTAARLHWFCSVGYNGVAVTPDGSLFACHRLILPEYRLGDVWSGVDSARLMELFPNHCVDDHEPCSSCWARYFCGGGCYAENIQATGSHWKPWPTRCRIVRTTIEAVVEHYFVEPAKKRIRELSEGVRGELNASQT